LLCKQKSNLQLAHVNEGKAQLAGHFYEHGKAFERTSDNEIIVEDMDKKMPAQATSKKVHTATSILKGFKNFEIDNATGFPICPQTRKLIDGTVPYCKSCLSFGHSQISFTGCGKHNEWLAQNANKKQKEETDNKNKTSMEEIHEIND